MLISLLLPVCLHLYLGCIYSDEVKYVMLTLSIYGVSQAQRCIHNINRVLLYYYE